MGEDRASRRALRSRTFPADRNFAKLARLSRKSIRRKIMNGLIYLVGLVVVIMAVLSFFGLR
jgi:hypothetical protein